MKNSRDFLELAAKRYSVRRFSAEPVEQELIDKILQAGQLAPTACNNQPQRIYVFQSTEALEKMRRCTKSHFQAPLGMLVCYDKNESWKRSYDGEDSGVTDASIVTTHLMMEAAQLGVGSTWVMHFDPFAMRRELELAENLVPVALLVMGYPHKDARPAPLHTSFRPMEETVKLL